MRLKRAAAAYAVAAMRLKRAAACGVIAFAAACGGESADLARTATPMPNELGGFYAGEFPCNNCEAIAAALWVREDGVFFLRQRYTGGGAEDSVVHGLGRWRWDADAGQLVLEGAGPARRFRPGAQTGLELETTSPLPHVLARAAPEPFADRLRIAGLVVVGGGGGATLTECLTGLALPLAPGGSSAQLRRLYGRTITPGNAALANLEARLATSGESESWLVERVIELRDQETCP